MRTPKGLTRTDLTVAIVVAVLVAGTALYYGVPIWVLAFGAGPLLAGLLVVWLAGYRDTTYARSRREVDAAIFEATEADRVERAAHRRVGDR